VARIKIAYVGGGSTRGAGTMASFIAQAENFAGSEIVLVDLDAERLEIVRKLAERLARSSGADLTISATTDRRAGLTDADAILSSYRPGGFEARVKDERIPLRYDMIGQETQGPGGFFMALRAIHVLKGILADVEEVAPKARIFNYTNPVNILAQAVTMHSDIPFASFCEGPIYFADEMARTAGLDPERLETVFVGVNHNSWSVRQDYDGEDVRPLLEDAWRRRRDDPTLEPRHRRQLHLAALMGTIPAEYFMYYYFSDEILGELKAKPTTRAEDILAEVPGYWEHYQEQVERERPELDPGRSRGGIHELELAIDAMDAVFNDRGEVLPVNVPNVGRAVPDLPEEVVVEVPGRCGADWITPIPQAGLPRQVRGLVEMLAEYQVLAAEAAWSGTRRDAIHALAANPLVHSVEKAERLYDELAAAHRRLLPERLLA
jgi:6-phospho-beta-glucosidase